jgi:hypothetical protein
MMLHHWFGNLCLAQFSSITSPLCSPVSGQIHIGHFGRGALLRSQMSTFFHFSQFDLLIFGLDDIQSARGHSTRLCFSPCKYPVIQAQVEPRRAAETPSTTDLSSIIQKSLCRGCQVCLEHNLCLKQTLPKYKPSQRKMNSKSNNPNLVSHSFIQALVFIN